MLIKNCPLCGRYPYVYYGRFRKIHRFAIVCITDTCKNSHIFNGYGLSYDSAKTKARTKWNKYVDKISSKKHD